MGYTKSLFTNLCCTCMQLGYYFYTTGAIHRYYESRRRLFNDSRPVRRDKAAATKVRSRKQSLRKKVRIDIMYSSFDDSFSCCHLVVPEKAEVPKGRGRKENLGKY